jgi:molybdopterin-guanine dinucleotide biosynthesis protein A
VTPLRLAGAVLTGGASTRMGADKALFPVDGVPMAVRVAVALRSVGCDPVALIGGDARRLAALGEDLVADLAPGAGPAGGVRSAIEAFGGGADALVITSCDLAFVTAAQLSPLIDALDRDAADALIDVAVARTPERVQPLCGVWRSTTRASVVASFDSGVRSVFGLLDALRVEEVLVPAEGLRNINSVADLGAGQAQH